MFYLSFLAVQYDMQGLRPLMRDGDPAAYSGSKSLNHRTDREVPASSI